MQVLDVGFGAHKALGFREGLHVAGRMALAWLQRQILRSHTLHWIPDPKSKAPSPKHETQLKAEEIQRHGQDLLASHILMRFSN